MAKKITFPCSVITPERIALECDAQSVVFPAHDGEQGVLRGRAPLICRMGIGVLRIETPDGSRRLFVDGGFAQVTDGQLTLLTEQAVEPGELDAAAGETALVEARAMKITNDASWTSRSRAIQRARVQLKLVERPVG